MGFRVCFRIHAQSHGKSQRIQDYIRTARAKGVGERTLLFKHALRNAAIPIVTILGLQFGRLLGGAVVTETVFAWPGVASLAVKAIRTYDYPIAQASIL